MYILQKIYFKVVTVKKRNNLLKGVKALYKSFNSCPRTFSCGII